MRIGICASTFSKNGFGRFGDKTYIKLKEYGFSATDFGMADTDSVLYTVDQNESDALIKRERELAENAGIEIFQMHGPWRYPPRDSTDGDRAERMKKMKYSIRAASILGVKNWVVHPIMPFGTEDLKSSHEKETRDINIGFLRELVKTAKEYGVTICLENMPFTNFSLSSPEKVLEVVSTINDDNLRMCLDTGHVNVLKLDLVDEVYRVKDKLQVLHVHDNSGSDVHLLPYFGTINWKKFVKALKDVGFNGVFSLETNPPQVFSDELFERASILLCDVVKEMVRVNL